MTVGNNSAFSSAATRQRLHLQAPLQADAGFQEKTKSAEILYGLGCDPLRSGIIMYCHLKQYMYDCPACSTATN
jgi:hypothetical protein